MSVMKEISVEIQEGTLIEPLTHLLLLKVISPKQCKRIVKRLTKFCKEWFSDEEQLEYTLITCKKMQEWVESLKKDN